MQTSGLRDYRTRHGKPVRIQPFVYCGLQREGRCMNIWGEDGNGFTVEIHSYVTMLSAHVYLSLKPPLFFAACTVPTTKRSFEWVLAFIPNLKLKPNTGGEGIRTSQKHGTRSAWVSQVLVHYCAALFFNLAKLIYPTRKGKLVEHRVVSPTFERPDFGQWSIQNITQAKPNSCRQAQYWKSCRQIHFEPTLGRGT